MIGIEPWLGTFATQPPINFDALQAEPIQGQPADLLQEWLDITALKFPEDGGTLIDKYPPPPRVSPKGFDLNREKKQRGQPEDVNPWHRLSRDEVNCYCAVADRLTFALTNNPELIGRSIFQRASL